MSATPHDPGTHLDRIGTCASSLCAVHCFLTALALGLASFGWLGFMDNPILEGLFLGVAVTVGLAASIHGLRRHHSFRPALLLLLGLALILIAHFALARGGHTVLSGIVSALGGLSLVIFHLFNQRLGRGLKRQGRRVQ